MQVLIADDERLECEALEKMLRDHFPELAVLPSVSNGLELVSKVNECLPDIVIVDINMPDLDGLAALEILRGTHTEMEILIHTAYSDFDYIHKALKMGAADYLVKPVFEEDFVKIFGGVLKRALERRKLPGGFAGRKMKEEMQAVTADNIMMGLLLHQKDPKSWNLFWKASENTHRGEETGWVLSLSMEEEKDREALYAVIVSRLQCAFSLFSIVYQKVLYCLILSADFGPLAELLHSLSLRHAFLYRAGVSTLKEQYEEFPGAVSEADSARQNAEENTCRFYVPAVRRPREDHFFPLAAPAAEMLKKEGWQRAAEFVLQQSSGTDSFREELSFADQYYSERMVVQIAALLLKNRRTGMRWTIQNRMAALLDCKTEKGAALCTAVDGTLWFAHLQAEFRQMEEDLSLPVRKENPYVEQALREMNCRYSEELSLEQIAFAVGITQFYLSRLLKQERNQTFLELLTEIRITRALELMQDSPWSTQSISQAVGYTTKYFYQIFRNVMGVSQKEFRDALFCQ